MENIICIDLVIFGKVQGVGYRYFIKEKAESLGIKGYVRNEKNGSVSLLVQGKENAIESIMRLCHQGTHNSIVSRVEKKPRPLENFADFKILY